MTGDGLPVRRLVVCSQARRALRLPQGLIFGIHTEVYRQGLALWFAALKPNVPQAPLSSRYLNRMTVQTHITKPGSVGYAFTGGWVLNEKSGQRLLTASSMNGMGMARDLAEINEGIDARETSS